MDNSEEIQVTPTIVARHFTVSDALRTHINKCAARLPKFLDNIISCHVALSIEKYRRLAEVTVNVSGHTFKATGASHSLYVSIDDAFDKVIRQVKKQNEKQNIHRHPNKKALLGSESEEEAEEMDEFEDVDVEETIE